MPTMQQEDPWAGQPDVARLVEKKAFQFAPSVSVTPARGVGKSWRATLDPMPAPRRGVFDVSAFDSTDWRLLGTSAAFVIAHVAVKVIA